MENKYHSINIFYLQQQYIHKQAYLIHVENDRSFLLSGEYTMIVTIAWCMDSWYIGQYPPTPTPSHHALTDAHTDTARLYTASRK